MLEQMRETREKFTELERIAQKTNASLWLNKYIQDYDRDESRRELIEDVAKLPTSAEYNLFFARWEKMLKDGYGAQVRRVQVKGRMIVGLGNESVLETSICLHRIYGVPYIPGSALKGLAASYAHQRLGEEWQLGGTFHTIVFGNTDEAGYITFFDALYIPETGIRKQVLYPDVITVHHRDYYQDASQAPSDSDDPNPVPFLSATGTYLFALAAPDFQGPTRWVDITFQILAEALEHFGIGAKTSSGYGRMEFLELPVRPLDPEIKRANDAKSRLEALKESDVAGQINSYYQQWKQLNSQEARTILAQAIIEKVSQAKREKASAEKPWYKELRSFLDAFQA